MARNVSKQPSSSTEKVKGKGASLFAFFDSVFSPDKILGGEFPAAPLRYILWICFLIILYIGSSINTEGLIHRIDKAKAELEEVRTDYTTQQAAFMKAGKQSEVIKKVEKMGLEENKTPPTKIIVKDW